MTNYFPHRDLASHAYLANDEDISLKTKESFLSIMFSNYLDKKSSCGIENLEQSSARKVLNFFKCIGKCSSHDDVKNEMKNGTFKPVRDEDHYMFLFNSSEEAEQIEMWEYIIGSSARIFYYLGAKSIYIRCIQCSHNETSKKKKKRKKH